MHSYVRPPARYTLAVLLATRDAELMVHSRGKEGKEKPDLIPEFFESLKRFGRELRVSEDGAYTNLGELPESPGIFWKAFI